MENYLKIQLAPLHNASEAPLENLDFVIKNSEDFQEDTHVLKVENTVDVFDTLLEKTKK